MDFSSLYTNIDHEEGAEACLKKLEERRNKAISSIVTKNLILMILKSNAFRICNEYYRQITGTAMETPMAPNYVNLFLDNFEQNLLRDYSQKTGLSPLVWFRFIDDIFFIWTVNKDSLDHFISFTQNYSKSRNMHSKINFEIHLSTNEVHFIDETVSLNHGKLTTTLFTKPTDSHFCVNTSSYHPSHVVKNTPKGQFIRLRRVCSRKSDYLLNSEILCKKFIEHSFHEKELKKTIKQVAKMDRNELLQDRIPENKDPPTILVSTWHPKLSAIPSILKNNFHLISRDPKLSKIFKQKPTVTYRKNTSLSDHLLQNDIANQQLHSNVALCGKCKFCPQINSAKLITNDKLNITEKIKGTGNYKEREIIYAAQCPKHKVLHVGHTGDQLSERLSKLRYDIKNRPYNSKLAKHFHENHNLSDDLNATILENNIKTAAARRYHEDKWICKLKTLAPNGLRTLKLVTMLKKCTISTNSVTNFIISFDIMFT